MLLGRTALVVPGLAICLAMFGVESQAQPLSAHQAHDSVAIQNTHLTLKPDLSTQTLYGQASYTLQASSGATRFVPLLHRSLHVDSVKRAGVSISFVQTLDTVFIPLISSPSTQEVTVFYHGQPHVEAANFGGFHMSSSSAFNLGVAFGELPHPFGRTTFPAYDNFHARSTYALSLESDSGFSALAGGNLDSVQDLGQGRKRWHYSFTIPMPSYLIGVSWGRFAIRRGFLQGMNGPIPFHIATLKSDSNLYVTAYKHLQAILTIEEQAWGPYPFENIGFSMVGNIGGAMEHAGNIAMPTGQTGDSIAFTRLIAHELSHAWWGNHTTCARAEEMWLNEGWASYNELLVLEQLYSATMYKEEVRNQHRGVLLNARKRDKGAYPLNKVPQSFTYGMHSYTKGADIVAILRAQMGPSFFQAAKNHQLAHQNDTANTYQLEAAFVGLRPEIARPFFRNYVYSSGYPTVVCESHTATFPPYQRTSIFRQKHQYRYGSSYFDTLPVISHVYPKATFVNDVGCRDSLFMTSLYDSSIHCNNDGGILTFCADEQFGIASISELVDNPPPGIYNLVNGGITINVSAQDSLHRFLIEQHFVDPKHTGIYNSQWYKLNQSRYWTVTMATGLWETNLKVKGTFRFESQPYSIDDSLPYNNLNELVLFHRDHDHSLWSEAIQVVYSNSGNYYRSGTVKLISGDYVWGSSCGKLAIETTDYNHHASIYPNPTTGSVVIKGLEEHSLSSEIIAIDMFGRRWPINQTQMVATETVNGTQTFSLYADLSGMPSGVYLLTSLQGNNQLARNPPVKIILLPAGH